MGLIILIAVGAIIGWLASVVTRTNSQHGIAINVGGGIAGSLLTGALTSASSLLYGLSASSLLLAFVGAIGVLAVVNILGRGTVR